MTFEEAAQHVLAFRDERNWAQFHNPKDLAISINLEAAELLELFQWSGADLQAADKTQQMKDELADIAIYCIQMADRLETDLPSLIETKLRENEAKYPADLSRDNSRKYTQL